MIYNYYPQVPHSYRYELNKDMHLSAAHYIDDDLAGKCQKVHGHTYTINVTIVGDELDTIGFLIDFKLIKDQIHKKYDHSILNDHPDFKGKHPTTEVVAETITTEINRFLKQQTNQPKCIQTIVRETPTSYVVYRPKASEIG
ncbi:6-carboxytetrahydropterin synthase QueD [Alkalihalobacillus sp. 1P02AB]|uniref:6-carboxytetrahydropterin synthase QueD n=1 Tax=Alkalihalobacillus sp. 1P02AB TaxID=3132260 RepID=UPI0039A58C7D